MAGLETAGHDFLDAQRQCSSLLAALTTAGHLNLSLPGSAESYSTRLVTLLGALERRLPEGDLGELRARLLAIAGHNHENAAFLLNLPAPPVNLTAPLNPDTQGTGLIMQ